MTKLKTSVGCTDRRTTLQRPRLLGLARPCNLSARAWTPCSASPTARYIHSRSAFQAPRLAHFLSVPSGGPRRGKLRTSVITLLYADKPFAENMDRAVY